MHKGVFQQQLAEPEKAKNGDWPECADFYALMQRYRHMQPVMTGEVVKAYESIKTWLRKHRYD